jgi:hypothetical protein
VLHGLTGGPADQEREVSRPGRVAAHVAVMETEEVKSLASLTQVHDPRLGVL